MRFDFIHPGKPVPKGRPRFSKHGGVYTPAATKLGEEDLLLQYISQHGPEFLGPVGVDLTFTPAETIIGIYDETWPSTLRGDLDNYVKLVLDALDKTAWKNDRQVVTIRARKLP